VAATICAHFAWCLLPGEENEAAMPQALLMNAQHYLTKVIKKLHYWDRMLTAITGLMIKTIQQ
jgi:hypothetical protein